MPSGRVRTVVLAKLSVLISQFFGDKMEINTVVSSKARSMLCIHYVFILKLSVL